MANKIVINSPFPDELPNGTEVMSVKAPIKTYITQRSEKKHYSDDWYKRADGVKILERSDGYFRLFNKEIKSSK